MSLRIWGMADQTRAPAITGMASDLPLPQAQVEAEIVAESMPVVAAVGQP